MASNNNLSDEMIDELEDLDEAFSLMEAFMTVEEEIKNVKDVQRELRRHLHSTTSQDDAYKITAEASTKVIQNLMDSNRIVREKLQKLINDCCSLIKRLPPEKQDELSTIYPAAIDTLEDIVKQLESQECVILVAGETGAGKSTLLNLLLGELTTDLLPVAHLSSTSAICELKYSAEKKMVVYPIDSTEEEETINLQEEAAETIFKFVHQRCIRTTTTFAYSKVALYWPSEWLKGGITIVDSPGVGEDTELTELVKQYLHKAFGFIYVINTPNAGGIDPDRLQDLILSHLVGKEKDEIEANPRSAVFVCNKWDNIPHEERSAVKKYVMSKLHKTWPGFTEDQLFFLSAKEARTQLRDSIVSRDYQDLLHGLERLIPFGLNHRLRSHYLKAFRIMERCTLIVQTHISSMYKDSDQIKEKMKHAKSRLAQLASQPYKLKKNLDEQIKFLNERAYENLKDHLLNEKTLESLCSWSVVESEPLMSCSSIEILTDRMSARVCKRIKGEINDWDATSGVFEKTRKELFDTFKEEFQFIENERKLIEENFSYERTDDLNSMINDIVASQEEDIPTHLGFSEWEKIAISISAPIWVPIGLMIGLLVLPFAGYNAYRRHKEEMKALHDMKENINQNMAVLTKTMVREVVDNKDLSKIIEDRMKQLTAPLNQLLENVPLLIKSDQQMINNIESDRRINEKEVNDIYVPLYMEAHKITNYLDLLYFMYFRPHDVVLSDLFALQELTAGSWAKVYKAKWQPRNEETVVVAVKEMKESVTVVNVSKILMEEEILRKLQSPNVVQFYGTSMRKDGYKCLPLLVMEYCDKTLAMVIHDDNYQAPGRVTELASKISEEAKRTAIQVASGLDKIHQCGNLHPDLKCENIRINREGIVKLVVTKKTVDITEILVSSIQHIAPEVLQGMNYTSKADMFSYGMILWEVWYGGCIKHLKGPPKDIHCSGANEQNPIWKQLMEKCLEPNPEIRPTASDCISQLNEIQ